MFTEYSSNTLKFKLSDQFFFIETRIELNWIEKTKKVMFSVIKYGTWLSSNKFALSPSWVKIVKSINRLRG